jgi:hypothetical protein
VSGVSGTVSSYQGGEVTTALKPLFSIWVNSCQLLLGPVEEPVPMLALQLLNLPTSAAQILLMLLSSLGFQQAMLPLQSMVSRLRLECKVQQQQEVLGALLNSRQLLLELLHLLHLQLWVYPDQCRFVPQL